MKKIGGLIGGLSFSVEAAAYPTFGTRSRSLPLAAERAAHPAHCRKMGSQIEGLAATRS